MWEFIVSGRVPGSAIHVTFELWVKAMAMVAATIIAVRLVAILNRRRRLMKTMLDAPQFTETTAAN